MHWFGIISVLVFVLLIIRSMARIHKNASKKARDFLLILIFLTHIVVICYLSFD